MQGTAAENIPDRVYAIVDLYGKCAQISIVPSSEQPESKLYLMMLLITVELEVWPFFSYSKRYVPQGNYSFPLSDDDSGPSICSRAEDAARQITDHVGNLSVNMSSSNQEQPHAYLLNDRLRFHSRCGTLVKLSCNGRTAERRKPLDEFNNGVVMTHRPLRDNELFEVNFAYDFITQTNHLLISISCNVLQIRIDRLVDKWSGSIEVGVTTHNPSKLEFPATMTNMKSGTTIMSGCGILTNGTGTRREYGEFNLDELRVIIHG